MEKGLSEIVIGAKGLNFYTITVGVLKKTKKKTFTNKKTQKEGVRFGVLIVDKDGRIAECSSFTEGLYDLLKEEKCYKIQKFEVQQPYDNVQGDVPFEIMLQENTTIIPTDGNMREMVKKIKISRLREAAVKKKMNVEGICTTVAEFGAGRNYKYTVKDEAGDQIELKIWRSGDQNMRGYEEGSMVRFYNIKFDRWDGKLQGNSVELTVTEKNNEKSMTTDELLQDLENEDQEAVNMSQQIKTEEYEEMKKEEKVDVKEEIELEMRSLVKRRNEIDEERVKIDKKIRRLEMEKKIYE